jgi:hypothetical protein
MQSNGTTNQAETQPSNTAPLPPRLAHLEKRLIETFDELWDDLVDPADDLYDFDGTRWGRLGGAGPGGSNAGVPFTNEQQLAEIRAQCRALAMQNEFAINGHDRPLTKSAIRAGSAEPL